MVQEFREGIERRKRKKRRRWINIVSGSAIFKPHKCEEIPRRSITSSLSMDLGGPPFPGASTALTGEVSQELNLQTLLVDERMRCQHHKTNYQNIKEELSRLQLELNGAQADLGKMRVDRDMVKMKLKKVSAELRAELGAKNIEVQELRDQVLTEHKLELLKVKFQNELEAPMRETCTKLRQDRDFYCNEFNKVRYESMLLKAEFDHQQKQQTQLLEENRLKHQAEITQINEECQELRSRLSTGALAQERRRADALESEKVRLGQRMTSLEVELAEIRARADDARNRAESERRTLAQQLTDTQAALSIAESDGQIAREHSEQVKREESKCREQNLQLSTKLRSAERDIGAHLAKMEELKHDHRREVTSIRLEAAQCRTQLEQEKDDVQDQLEALRTELHFEKEEQVKLEKRLVAASKDATQRENSAQQQESARYTALLRQKLELEMLQSQAEDREASFLTERSRWEEERTACQVAKEMITREILALRNELQQVRSELQKCDKTEVESLNKNLEAVKEDLRKLSASEHGLSQENGRLQEAARHKDNDIKHLSAMLERAQTEAERLMQIHQVEWLEEKHHLIDRTTQLDKQLAEAKNKIGRAKAAQNKRKKLDQLREKRFVEKLQLLKAQKEEMELQNTIFKKNVPHEEHDRLRRCLKELQRRHDEFMNIILGHVVPGQRLTSLMPNFESTEAAFQERQHQQEVKMLKQRLEEVERNQRLQLEELKGPSRDPFLPTTHR